MDPTARGTLPEMNNDPPKAWNRSWALTAAVVVAAAGALVGGVVAACSSDDPAPKATTPDANAPEVAPEQEAGPTTILYERLGKRDGIARAVDAIVAEELKDPEIASYFFFQAGAPGNGHPTADQIKKCLVFQLSSATGGPEVYPPPPSDTGGYTCRSMTEAHASLHIPDSVYTKFINVAGGVLQGLKVDNADIETIAIFLDAFRSVIVDTTRDGGPFVPPGDGGDGGGDGAADGGTD
ncbi:MAG: group 1 truncated hemoglobin [Myxococcales bacterium]|jgi:hypothetical protein|nr:group 1 truncated hemoglobin [Myxococcales bacterium]